VFAQRHHPSARIAGDEALVDQRLQRDREDQRAQRREHQEQPGQRNAAAVRAQERQQAAERADCARPGAAALRAGASAVTVDIRASLGERRRKQPGQKKPGQKQLEQTKP
jgi:hypothetical protein